MTKHTPGPWEARKRGPYEWAIDAPRGDPDIGMASWDELATAYGTIDEGNLGRDKAKANAHLIAAAPEMYESLRAVLADVRNMIDAGVMPIDVMADITYVKARTAIAKAEGRG